MKLCDLRTSPLLLQARAPLISSQQQRGFKFFKHQETNTHVITWASCQQHRPKHKSIPELKGAVLVVPGHWGHSHWARISKWLLYGSGLVWTYSKHREPGAYILQAQGTRGFHCTEPRFPSSHREENSPVQSFPQLQEIPAVFPPHSSASRPDRSFSIIFSRLDWIRHICGCPGEQKYHGLQGSVSIYQSHHSLEHSLISKISFYAQSGFLLFPEPNLLTEGSFALAESSGFGPPSGKGEMMAHFAAFNIPWFCQFLNEV